MGSDMFGTPRGTKVLNKSHFPEMTVDSLVAKTRQRIFLAIVITVFVVI
jgi:hypothetical protein